MQQKISVTRALSELKKTGDQLGRLSASAVYVSATVGRGDRQRTLSGIRTPEAERREIQGNFDQFNAVFQRRRAIKSALVKSNATTMVTIAGETMSVAEAIEMKRTMEFRRQQVNYMKNQLNLANAQINAHNLTLNQEIEANLSSIYGSEKNRLDQSIYQSVAGPKLEAREAAVLDPLNISERIKELEKVIEIYDTELDFTLSESNARTEVEVDL